MKKTVIKYHILPPDPYFEEKNAGINQMKQELLQLNMEKFFPEISKEDYQESNRIFQEMLKIIEDMFKSEYNFNCRDVFINNNYQQSFNSYAYVDSNYPVFIHIDQLFESLIFSFMLTMLKWAKEFEKDTKKDEYFKYLLFLLNEVGAGELPDENAKSSLMDKIQDDQQILNLAAGCHWMIMSFTIAHEFAHAYQKETNFEYWDNYQKEAEFNADKIAYDIVLKMIMNKKNKEFMLEEYTYLGPMMCMDFFDLYYFTNYVLYGMKYESRTHPTPEKRKEMLFKIVEEDIYQFNTEDGNVIYQWFCEMYDIFKQKLVRYKENGNLQKLFVKDKES